MNTTVMEAAGGPTSPPRRRAPLIILVGADKGGVGKTTISRVLMDYLPKRGVQVRAFDTEAGEGVLRRFFPEIEQLNLGSVQGQMKVVDAAKGDSVTLVDARAGALSPILTAFHRIDLLQDVRTGALNLLVLHVVGSSVASSREIEPVIESLKGASLIRVNCKTNADAAFAPQVPGEVTIEVPNLEEEAYAAVDKADASFSSFAADAAQSRVLRGYVRAWIADVFAAFDRAGIGSMVKETE